MFWSRKTVWNLGTILMTVAIFLVIDIEDAKADFFIGEPINLGSTVNTSSHDAGFLSADGLSLYIDTNRSGGYGWFDIWVTTRPSVSEPWSMPKNLGSSVNTESYEGSPSITADGLSLFVSNEPQPHDVAVSTRETTADPWSAPVNLGPPVNSSEWEWTQCISADGLELYFSSSRGGGSLDIWVTTRATIHDVWGEPVNLEPTVNSPDLEMSPFISADGLTLFITSERPGGYGGRDIWATTRATKSDPWAEPVNLGPPINTSAWDQTATISTDGSVLYFSSDRSGGHGGLDMYQAPIIPIVDFSGDGIVDAADVCIMVDHWGEDYSLCDIGPTPFGDGIVDVQDLVVLSEHLFEDVNDPTLIAHWPLDETEGMVVTDSAGDNNGYALGHPVWQPAGGQVGGALEFDGVDDFISTPAILNPSDGVFSVLAWIKGGAPGQVVLSQVGGANWLGTDPSAGDLMTELTIAGRNGRSLGSQAVITDGQWHRIGFVWDGLYRTLYVDGVVVAEDAQDDLDISSNGLYIGTGKAMEAGTFWSGLIDDVRIYNRVVSP